MTTHFQIKSNGKVLCEDCALGNGLFFRLKGLLGRRSLPNNEGIWIKPCRQIHMFFMKIPIDVIFLDKANRVVRIYDSIAPWQCSALISNAHSAVEIAAGVAKTHELQEGALLEFEEKAIR